MMRPEDWRRVDALLAEALEHPPGKRGAVLERLRDSEPEIVASVEELLASEGDAQRLFGDGTAPVMARILSSLAADVLEEHEPPPSQVGSYRILRELGRGGMGAVYLGERADEEFERQVALKLVKRGMDSEEIVRRFRHERQILASLDHPGIASLYDGGIAADGRPFLVMQYVPGEPLDRYCDARRLGVRERARLLESICDAVAYAHRSLVVHRDLKASNILVTADGTPMLLDFGIAKLLGTGDGAGPDAPATRTGLRLLTPEYASPEQLAGDRVTVATDVYALGVLMYLLLTGHYPFARTRDLAERERLMREGEPERMSAIVLRDDAPLRARERPESSPATHAAARGTTPERLARELRGDLDNMVRKALARDPRERYASAESLLEDLRRYRVGLPVRARPATLWYRTTKLIRRRRLETVAASVVLMLGVTGASAFALQSAETSRERERAERELARANEVTRFLAGMLGASDPRESRGEEITARQLLDRGFERIETDLAAEPLVQAAMYDVMGRVYERLGSPREALVAAERALERRLALHGEHSAEVAESRTTLSAALQLAGDYAGAEPHLRESLRIRRALFGGRHRLVSESLSNLALLLTYRGAYDEAEPLLQEALAIDRHLHGNAHRDVASDLNNLAVLQFYKGDYAAAEGTLREALAIRREVFGDPHPLVANTMNNLAVVLQRRGDLSGSESLHREHLEMQRRLHGPAHPDVASALSNLGALLIARKRYGDAEPVLREAVETGRAAIGRHPEVADALVNLAVALRELGQHAEAEPLAREALVINRDTRGEEHPRTGMALFQVAMVVERARGCRPALPLYRQALQLQERALDEDHESIAFARGAVGGCLVELGQLPEAEALLLRSLAALRDREGATTDDLRQAVQRVVALYRAWDRPEEEAAHATLLAQLADR